MVNNNADTVLPILISDLVKGDAKFSFTLSPDNYFFLDKIFIKNLRDILKNFDSKSPTQANFFFKAVGPIPEDISGANVLTAEVRQLLNGFAKRILRGQERLHPLYNTPQKILGFARKDLFDENDFTSDNRDKRALETFENILKALEQQAQLLGVNEEEKKGENTPSNTQTSSPSSSSSGLSFSGVPNQPTAPANSDTNNQGAGNSPSTPSETPPAQQPPSETSQGQPIRLEFNRLDFQYELGALQYGLLRSYGLDPGNQDVFSLVPNEVRQLLEDQLRKDFYDNFDSLVDPQTGRLSAVGRTRLYSAVFLHVQALGGLDPFLKIIEQHAKKTGDTQVLEKLKTTTVVEIAKKSEETAESVDHQNEFAKKKEQFFKEEIKQLAIKLQLENPDQFQKIIDHVYSAAQDSSFVQYFDIPPEFTPLIDGLDSVGKTQFLMLVQKAVNEKTSFEILKKESQSKIRLEKRKKGKDILLDLFQKKGLDPSTIDRQNIERFLDAYALGQHSPEDLNDLIQEFSERSALESDKAAKLYSKKTLTEYEQRELQNIQALLALSDQLRTVDAAILQNYIDTKKAELAALTGNTQIQYRDPFSNNAQRLQQLLFEQQLLQQGFSTEDIAIAKYGNQGELTQSAQIQQQRLLSYLSRMGLNSLRYDDFPQRGADLQTIPGKAIDLARNAGDIYNTFRNNRKKIQLAQEAVKTFGSKATVPLAIGGGTFLGGLAIGGLLSSFGQAVAISVPGALGGLVGFFVGGPVGAVIGASLGALGGKIGFETFSSSFFKMSDGLGVQDGLINAKNTFTSVSKSVGQHSLQAGKPVVSTFNNTLPGTQGFAATASNISITLPLIGTSVTVGIISILSITTILIAFLPDMNTTFEGAQKGEFSRYVDITKEVSPSSLSNNYNESPTQVTYTITITPKNGHTITPIKTSDTFSYLGLKDAQKIPVIDGKALSGSLDHPINPPLSTPITDKTVITYTIDVKGEDVLISNAFSMDFEASKDGQTASDTLSTTASLTIGNPETGCFEFGDAGYQTSVTDIVSKTWPEEYKSKFFTAYLSKLGGDSKFVSLLCGKGKITMYYFGDSRPWGGWVLSPNAFGFYKNGLKYGIPSIEYTIAHEFMHLIDKRNSGLFSSYLTIKESTGCYSYPVWIPGIVCSPPEAFAEGGALYVVSKTYVFPHYNDKYDFQGKYPEEYNWYKNNVFSKEF